METLVAEYRDALPEEKRAALMRMREVILRELPGIAETIEYGMPAYRLGEIILGLAARKQNIAFYSCEIEVVNKYRSRLANLDCGKSCIRFRKPSDMPLDVITDIVRDWRRRTGSSS
jgi:uncharacterized protein YdhG (YjbR/CyaY superfamily)